MPYAADILSRKGRKEVRSRDYAKSGQEIEYSFLGRLRFPWQVTLQLSTETFCAVRRSALIPFRCGKQFISFRWSDIIIFRPRDAPPCVCTLHDSTTGVTSQEVCVSDCFDALAWSAVRSLI